MTNMLSTPEELLAKPCDQWCELEILSAYRAIKELVAERDELKAEVGPSLVRAFKAEARAEKAEADLAAAREAIQWAWGMRDDLTKEAQAAIAAARAEKGGE